MLVRSLILKVSSRPWFERFIKHSRLTRGVVKRFVAGDTLEDAMVAAEELAAQGFFVTLDLLGENTKTTEQADSAAKEYEAIVERIALSKFRGGQAPERINISIKLTQLGLAQDADAATVRLANLLELAASHGNFIRIDMEDSSVTDKTIDTALKCFPAHRNVGVVVQSMLHRAKDDMCRLLPTDIRMRLVKGAYLEPADLAFQEKSQVDGNYLTLAELLIGKGTYPAFGTHDESIIARLKGLADVQEIDKSKFEFQLLYGIKRQLQQQLKSEGYNVRVYVPYGSSWYPYFTRRLAERPANLLFFFKSLFSK